MIKLNQRQWFIFLAFVATLIALYFAPPQQTETLIQADVIPVNKVLKDNNIKESLERHESVLIKNRIWDTEKSHDLFPGKMKPLPVMAISPQAKVPPPVPTAPPLPFTYIGKVIEDDKPTVFVSKQQKNYLLKGGEILDGTYKVDKVESGRVVFTYLPLETEQVMIIGGKD